MEQLTRFYSAEFHFTLIHNSGTSMYSIWNCPILNTVIDDTIEFSGKINSHINTPYNWCSIYMIQLKRDTPSHAFSEFLFLDKIKTRFTSNDTNWFFFLAVFFGIYFHLNSVLESQHQLFPLPEQNFSLWTFSTNFETMVNCTVQMPRMKWRELPTIPPFIEWIFRSLRFASPHSSSFPSPTHSEWNFFLVRHPCARTARQNFVLTIRCWRLCAFYFFSIVLT